MDKTQIDTVDLIEKQPSVAPSQIPSLLGTDRTKGDFVFVLFWAEWCKFCGPAKEGFADFVRSYHTYDLPALDIWQYKMLDLQEVRKHEVVYHPDSPWPDEKIAVTSIPTFMLIRVKYQFPSLFAKDKAMTSGNEIAQWIKHCINNLSK